MPFHRRLHPLLLALAVSVLGGCEEPATMVSEPPATASDWILMHPDAPRVESRIIWARDADDVWVGSRSGQMAHYDGRRVTIHQLETDSEIARIDGAASDDVWALTSGDQLFHWDGRRWTAGPEFPDDRSYDLDDLSYDAPGELYVSGALWNVNAAMIARWDGSSWKQWVIPTEERWYVQLDRPHADGPLIAVVQDHDAYAYALRDGFWRRLDWPGEVRQIAGTLLLAQTESWPPRESLHRILPDASCELLCDDTDLNGPLVDSQWPLVVGDSRVYAVVDCGRRPVGDLYPQSGHGPVSVPERPGRNGSVFYAANNRGDLLRFRWTASLNLERECIMGGEDRTLYPPIIADGQRIFARDRHDGRLMVCEDGQWRRDQTDGPYIRGMQLAHDRTLLVWTAPDNRYGRRLADGTWHWYPTLNGVQTLGAGLDPATGDLYVVLEEPTMRFLVCRDGAWQVLDELGVRCHHYMMAGVDQQYAVVRDLEDESRILCYDGEAWRDAMPPDVQNWDSVEIAPLARRLIIRYWDESYRYWLAWHDGATWQRRAWNHDSDLYFFELRDTLDGSIYTKRSDHQIYQLHPNGWKLVWDLHADGAPGTDIFDYWVDPELGLLVFDHSYQLHRLPGIPR